MWVVRALLVVALVAVILGFSVYNAEERVAVSLLNTRYITVPLIFVAYWAFSFGMAVSFLLFVTVYFKQMSELRRQKRINESLDSEVAALRNRTIEESDNLFLRSEKEDSQ